MNNDFDESLLTAYLDGELTKAQRRRVEEHLRQSPESRQTLKQLAEVSALLRALPSESLHEAFPQQVLQAAKEPPLPVLAKPAVSKRVIWWGAGVAAAAVLLLMVFSSPEPEKELFEIASREEAKSDQPEAQGLPPVARQKGALSFEEGEGNRVAGEPTSPSASRQNSQGFLEMHSREDSRRRGRASRRGRVHDGSRQTAELFESLPKEAPASPPRDLYRSRVDHMDPSEVVKAAKPQGNQVRVIELTVVDREKSIEAIQKLFREAQVVELENGQRKSDADGSGPSQAILVSVEPQSLEMNLGRLQKEHAASLVSLRVRSRAAAPLQNWLAKQQKLGEPTKNLESYDGALNLLDSEEREQYRQEKLEAAKRRQESDEAPMGRSPADHPHGMENRDDQPFSVFLLIREQSGHAPQ